MIYLDTSYLAKCYVNETGFAQVRQLAARSAHIACCTFGRAELAAAVHRKFREGELGAQEVQVIFEQVALDAANRVVRWLPLAERVLSQVAYAFRMLPADVFLRAGDAVHLVCARDQGFSDIYSSDRHLLAAAPHFGLRGLNILG